jgi:AraC-like DNA-binding protein
MGLRNLKAQPELDPVIHSIFAAAAIDYFGRQGGDAAALRRRLDLPETTGPMPGLDVTTRTERLLSQAVAEALGDSSFGLRIAATLPRGALGVFEFAICNAPTLRGALERVVLYTKRGMPAHVPQFDCFAFEVQPGGGIFTHRVVGDPRTIALQRYKDEFILGVIVRLCRRLIGEGWAPKRVCFASPAPADRADLERFFGTTEIAFDEPDASLWLDDAALHAPLAASDSALLPILEDYAQTLLPRRSSRESFADRVRDYLRGRLREGPPSIEEAAAALHVSTRTLQRRLAETETDYASVLAELRRQLSMLYLADPARPLAEVSLLLGYSDPRAFVRAFKGWTGTTPGRYRARTP